MLAHLMNIERLCCFQGLVAYAHRQRYVALRANTKHPENGVKRRRFFFHPYLIGHVVLDIIRFCLRKPALANAPYEPRKPISAAYRLLPGRL